VSTNIAESSITLNNVSYVIDFCCMKEIRYNSSSGLERLDLAWASKASLRQRSGRTGRVCNGFSIKLIPKYFHDF
jgi:ATP-dependent RNA helicase TDRD9